MELERGGSLAREREQGVEDGVKVIGNKDIPTKFGLVSVEVNPQSLRNELITAVNVSYPESGPNSEFFRSRGREWAERVVVGFDRDALISYLNAGSPSGFSDDALGEFSINSASREAIFYLNIRGLAKRNETPQKFIEDFRHVWVHERHHFVQHADPRSAYAFAAGRELLFMEWIVGLAGIIGGGVFLVPQLAKRLNLEAKATRRNFLKAGVLLSGSALYGTCGIVSLGKATSALYYAPFTNEGQAETVDNSGNYALEDLRKTFNIQIKNS